MIRWPTLASPIDGQSRKTEQILHTGNGPKWGCGTRRNGRDTKNDHVPAKQADMEPMSMNTFLFNKKINRY
jgi:hypothetical protein